MLIPEFLQAHLSDDSSINFTAAKNHSEADKLIKTSGNKFHLLISEHIIKGQSFSGYEWIQKKRGTLPPVILLSALVEFGKIPNSEQIQTLDKNNMKKLPEMVSKILNKKPEISL